ncbi:MAG: glycine cleavage system aminomethyltransferase GcvT, partial [Deltaproteobacteria bacterium]|nr:glycine cleavage system aminomethyltransferase GcvT [Deltaproteobacteria bacterium]
AVQGPASERVMELMSPGAGHSRKDFPLFAFRETPWTSGNSEWHTIVARTGYSGEDGFEIFMPNSAAAPFWSALLERGAPLGIQACGLGARDTLRLEAALPLYGHELRDDLNIAASNVAWTIKCEKGEFVGSTHIKSALENGFRQKLCGLEVLDPGIVRDGVLLYSGTSNVGFVTSGTKTPTVNKSIALAYLDYALATPGIEVEADVRGRRLRVRVVPLPFYRRPKAASS